MIYNHETKQYKFVIKVTIKIPPHIEHVATLPCETLVIFWLIAANWPVFFAPPRSLKVFYLYVVQITGPWSRLATTIDSTYEESEDLRVALSGTTLHMTNAGRLRLPAVPHLTTVASAAARWRRFDVLTRVSLSLIVSRIINKCSAVAEMGGRLATTDMDRKLGAVPPFFGGESWSLPNTTWPGPRPTSVPSGILIRLAVWPQHMGRKLGRLLCPTFWGGEAGSSSHTMCPGPRPTSMPSFLWIHSAVWPQYTNVKQCHRRTDRTGQDRQTGQLSDSIGKPSDL